MTDKHMTSKQMRIFRIQYGFTRAELAEAIGYSPGTIAQYENNQREIPLRVKISIENILTELESGV